MLTLVVVGYIFYRRRESRKEATAKDKALADVKPDIPARADAVLSRPDPHVRTQSSKTNSEKTTPNVTELGVVRVYENESNINLDPAQDAQSTKTSARSNPFSDGDATSIQTASERSQSTNVIPIALVPPGSHSSGNSCTQGHHQDSSSDGVDPGLHPDFSYGNIRAPYASSARSGISGKTFMTTSSVASFDEQPTIMTPQQGVMRQVLEVTQAQVVRVPSNGSSAASKGSRGLNRKGSRNTIGKSPLNKSYTPTDIPLVATSSASATRNLNNPFNDPDNKDVHRSQARRTTDTFGQPRYDEEPAYTEEPLNDSKNHRLSFDDAYSVKADIVVAERAIINMRSPSAQSGPLSPSLIYSPATSMRTSGARTDVYERDYDDVSNRPNSTLSSNTASSRTDSVLSKFPFVPPSPISSLPSRSPVVPGVNSPSLAGSTFAKQQAETGPRGMLYPRRNQPPQSPLSTATTRGSLRDGFNNLPTPVGPGRTVSTATSSTGSGLDSYMFEIHDADDPLATSVSKGSQRASLDTLAITQDLASI